MRSLKLIGLILGRQACKADQVKQESGRSREEGILRRKKKS